MKTAHRGKTKRRKERVRLVSKPHLISLFEKAAKEVPAYKAFLRSKQFDASNVHTLSDWTAIPVVSKDNYLRANQYRDLFWKGSAKHSHILTSTSGSTGEPVYFARSHAVDEQSSLIHEAFFRNSSLSKDKPTLVVVCFGMGVWIGGLITYQAFELMGKRGYPVSIITPGLNKAEIFKVFRKIAPQYEQLILVGYPPFIKDVLDEASDLGISFKGHTVGLIFAAEAFTEHFRDYVKKKAGIKHVLTDTMNIYGSADLGTMAFETPLSILIRRLATNKPKLFKELFGNIMKTPTLAQFIPEYTHFESVDGELLVTADSAMPLIRYAIGDNGGVYRFANIKELFKRHGIDLEKEMKAAGVPHSLARMPFVYVYERKDLSTTLYGLQVYPETIKETLLQEAFNTHLTGRIALATKFDERHDQYLEINIELRKGREVSRVLSSKLLAEISKDLMLKNAEYRELSNFLGRKAEPRLVFWPHEDPLYFRPDIKQKWVVKQ